MVSFLRQNSPLSQQKREKRETLLALGAVGAKLAAIAEDRQLVTVGPVRGESTFQI